MRIGLEMDIVMMITIMQYVDLMVEIAAWIMLIPIIFVKSVIALTQMVNKNNNFHIKGKLF